jgi:hypothetical protein
MTSPYFNRFDPAKNYEAHRFVPARPLQSAELNEIQSRSAWALQGVADTILKDGSVIKDAQIIVNPDTGATQCEAGRVYLRGLVRDIPSATFTVPIVGTIAVGLRLRESIVTALEDVDLLDPATGTRAYNQEGAERLKVEVVWAWSGDTQDGEFFPVYTVVDGIVSAKEPPPQLDGVTQSIARYDRDSAGGNYVVSGLRVTRLADRVDGYQVFTVAEGKARVNGFSIEIRDARRLARNALPVLRFIDSEPTSSSTAGAQRINVARPPLANVTQVRITNRKTVTINHGTVTGAQDPIPDTSVIDIVSAVQGGTTYVKGTDYKLTSGKVDWSLPGAEPAPGSSYDLTYDYIQTVTPTAVDDSGFTVTGAVIGTLIQTSYNTKLPRIDRLCLNQDGEFFWVEGTSTDYNPVRPSVPPGTLALAQVVQFWTSASYVINDGVRVVPMQDIEAINSRLDLAIQLISEQKLQSDAGQRQAAAIKGMFVDPFLNDALRDQGLAQDAAIVNGELMLPIIAEAKRPNADVSAPVTCAFTTKVSLAQERRTGFMKINPYLSFAQLPAKSSITPAIDRWTEFNVVWSSPVTQIFESTFSGGIGNGTIISAGSSTTIQSRLGASRELQFLRQIFVSFRLEGFGGGELLSATTFDGLPVVAVAP